MKIDYDKIYKKAAKQGGWSSGKPDTSTTWGDIYINLSKELTGKENVLDIGTAEGLLFMNLAKKAKKCVGIDIEPEMISLAKANAKKQGVKNIEFLVMDADKLKFPRGIFDYVVAKHCSINLEEISKILKDGGIFITQQVAENDKVNLKKAFGRGQDFGKKTNTRLNRYVTQAKKHSFVVIKKKTSNTVKIFKDKAELEDYLSKTPSVPNFGSKKDYLILDKFIGKKKKLKSNTARFLLILKKA
jgi:ubiquinone/menaquinone biosynthesis C-methylase UbiE